MENANRDFSDGLKRLLRSNPTLAQSDTRERAVSFRAAQEGVARLMASLAYPMERVSLELKAGSLGYFREGSDRDRKKADGKKASYRFAGVKKEHAEELEAKLAARKKSQISQAEFEAWTVPFMMKFTFEIIELFSLRALPPPAVGAGETSMKRVRWRLAEAIDDALTIRANMSAGNLCLIAEVALKRRGKYPSVLVDELFTYGYDGLITAINRYDPDVGQFSTYAFKWIQQAIDRGAMKVRHVIRIPIGVQDKQAKSERLAYEGGPAVKKARDGLPVIPIVQSLDEPMINFQGGELNLRDVIPDPSTDEPITSVEREEVAARLTENIRKLDPLSQLVIALRFDIGDAGALMTRFVRQEGNLSRKRARNVMEAAAGTSDEPARLRVVDTPSLSPPKSRKSSPK